MENCLRKLFRNLMKSVAVFYNYYSPIRMDIGFLMNMQNELRELQNNLAQIDFIIKSRKSSKSVFFELLLLRLQNLKIKMYQERAHNMPHIHIDYNKQSHVASYAIHSGLKIEGDLNKKYDETISNWILKNQDNLLKIWESLKNGDDPPNNNRRIG